MNGTRNMKAHVSQLLRTCAIKMVHLTVVAAERKKLAEMEDRHSVTSQQLEEATCKVSVAIVPPPPPLPGHHFDT